MIVIIDYNVGNLKSVVGAFKRIGLEAVVSRDEKVIKKLMELFYHWSRNFSYCDEEFRKVSFS